MDPRVELAGLTDGAAAAAVLAALDGHRVVISAPPDRCVSLADQAALFNATNLVGRMFAHVALRIDAGVPCVLRVGAGETLLERLSDLVQVVGPAEPAAVPQPGHDLHLAWGQSPVGPGAGVAADAAGWTYSVGTRHTELAGAGRGVAFGGLAATSLAAGQLLGRVLSRFGGSWFEVDAFVGNLLNYAGRPAPPRMDAVVPVLGEQLLAGGGSVGSSSIYMGLLSGVSGGPITAVDPDGLSKRNHLRYPGLIAPARGPKVDWLAALANGSGLIVVSHHGDIADYLVTLDEPPCLPLVLSSVDTVEGRREATDLLAARTLNAGVAGLQLHISAHGFGEDGCAFCQYVDAEPALEASAMLAQAIGLPVERVLAIRGREGRLNTADAAAVVAAGILHGPVQAGDRLEDLHRRAYAQATVQVQGSPPLQVSAPHVSAMAGLLLLVEAVKSGTPELAPYRLSGRVDMDMSGRPAGFVLPAQRDATRRCLCWSEFRRTAHARLHAD